MAEPSSIPAGKLPAGLLAELLAAAPGGPDVLLGPAVGEDAAAVELPGDGRHLLVVATDPITLTSSAVGAYAVVVNANDVAVCGARPRWFLATVLLPPGTGEAEVRALFGELTGALDEVGAALVGGHTEVTAAVTQPVVVGQMLGLAERLVATSGARPGDVLVQLGPAPVEGAAVLAGRVEGGVDAGVLESARRAVDDPGISVVEAALAAAAAGATSLHDPTEGGLAAALHEVAAAAGVGLVVDRDAVDWFRPGLAVCDAVGADPWATLASGCVLATFPPAAVPELGVAIGEVVDGGGVADRGGEPIPWPDRDEVARLTDA